MIYCLYYTVPNGLLTRLLDGGVNAADINTKVNMATQTTVTMNSSEGMTVDYLGHGTFQLSVIIHNSQIFVLDSL